MSEKPLESWRFRGSVAEALDAFNSTYMQEVWSKALARRETDPEGAVTSARTLLEAVCKHILDAANREFKEGLPLPKLYEAASEVLEIAPNENMTPIFKSLFTACVEIIDSVGRLRNHLSDSHGRGPFGAMPDWRHAELAVNLSGAMATYLAAVWKGRQPTVRDEIEVYFARREEEGDPFDGSQRFALEKIARGPLGDIVASKLQATDLLSHCESRFATGVQPQTVRKDFDILRRAVGQHAPDAFRAAQQALLNTKVYQHKYVARVRRVRHDEFDAVLEFFQKQNVHHRTVVRMSDLIEFAVWSGRAIGQICALRWSGVDFTNRTATVPGKKESFPLLEKAWDIIKARHDARRDQSEDRIFPYNARTAIARHVEAKKALAKEGKLGKDLRLNDYRYEAASRLLEKGHRPDVVARAIGGDLKRVVKMREAMEKAGTVESSGVAVAVTL